MPGQTTVAAGSVARMIALPRRVISTRVSTLPVYIRASLASTHSS